MQFPFALPLIQAPMAGGFTTVALVTEVAKAGALGSFGMAYTEPSKIIEDCAAVKAQTDGAFAVNLFLHEGEKPTDLSDILAFLKPLREKYNLPLIPNLSPKISLSHQFEAIIAAKPSVFSSTLGAPTGEMIKACKERGILVFGTATTLEEALFLEERGVDAIVLQGVEAGGHRGTFLESNDIGIFALLECCAPCVKTPLIAAGGIMSGRGVKAALTLGARAAMLGTAFMSTLEAGTPMPHRELLKGKRNTVLTAAYTGRKARGITNKLYDELKNLEGQTPPFDVMNALTRDIRGASMKANDAEYMSLWAGQGYRASREMSAKDLIETLIHEMI
jgi:nitronate monooxygenase